MLVILKEDMSNLGFKDEVVDVKPGYGRNFLIPQGKAVIASESALKVLAENQRQQAKKLEQEKGAAEALAAKMEGTALEFEVKTSEQGRIYGSVTAAHVADALEELGFKEINRKMLVVPGNIKEVGEYMARVRLHKDVTVEVPFVVKSDAPIVKPVEEEVEEEVAAEEEMEENPLATNAEVDETEDAE
ncbi:MAG: 50S ribosomal protein L9 [Porphyromonas sp.]|nr:50S ribosomal protein L9 [Porphyromonas sp.]